MDRQRLSMRNEAKRPNSPPLQGRGTGWGLSAWRLEEIGHYAADMRRQPTEPEKRLRRALSGSQLGGYKFRRQAVIGPFSMEGALTAILGALEAGPERWARPHPNPSPEGEGLA
jgi:Protein of unknown function (DUF559)